MGNSSHAVPPRLGPYELIERLATGGMAEVYLARRAGPRGFQKLVAVKRILPQLARDPDFVAMFVDEARVCANLSHPNIVQVFDFGEQDDELYMAMEYVDGTTGARLIRAAAAKGEELPLEVSLHVALSILRGLEYAHAARDRKGRPLNLVHRDVSPGNVLIDRSGAVKLTDFGIARASDFERRTDQGQLKGKLGYMSPEQVTGRELDARSDLFTVGIVLAELVTLRPLFSGGRELDVLLRIRDADLGPLDRAGSFLPDDVKSVLLRALARDKMLRYSNASVFAEAIEEIIRRRRLQVGPARLAAWVERLGLIDGPDVSSENEPSRPGTAILEPGDALRVDGKGDGGDGAYDSGGSYEVAPQIYRVDLGDGTASQPMSYPRIIELFATGAIGSRSLVARESGRFKPALHYKEFARFVTSPALRWDDDPEGTERTTLDRATLPAYLFQLALERETGALVFRNDEKRKKIFLVEGAPEFVASTDRRELLGEHLVASGQVLRMEVEMALAMLPKFGGRLGDALVGLGVLRPIELFRAIHDQTQSRYMDVLRWSEAEISFVLGARSHEETFPLGVDPFELIARGIRDGYTVAELGRLLGPIEDDVLERVPNPPVRIEILRLPERESYILRKVDGTSSLRALIGQMTNLKIADAEDVMRAVFIGLSCEILRSIRWTALHPDSGVRRSGAAQVRLGRP
ncbi:serine/threonine protein kinase [Pendulispora albinea]|uniref:Serine/threonine protein kinase n=1 Tax=Pendulispora albinea TaxID=2741071 RepID=A0ABZ2LP18_9BACT